MLDPHVYVYFININYSSNFRNTFESLPNVQWLDNSESYKVSYHGCSVRACMQFNRGKRIIKLEITETISFPQWLFLIFLHLVGIEVIQNRCLGKDKLIESPLQVAGGG